MSNTLGRQQTQNFYSDPEHGWDQVKAIWKETDQTGIAAKQLIYLTLRGKDWRKAFAVPNHLPRYHKGRDAYTTVRTGKFVAPGLAYSIYDALRAIHNHPTLGAEILKPFESVLNPNALELLRAILPTPQELWHQAKIECDWEENCFLEFNAYKINETIPFPNFTTSQVNSPVLTQ